MFGAVKVVDGDIRLAASDLSNFLACRHLTRLDHLSAHRLLKPAKQFDVGFQMLVERGDVHEANVLARFRADGLDVVEIAESTEIEAAAATRDALLRGVDVIYQGVLQAERGDGKAALLGRPDFLVRADLLPNAAGLPREQLHGSEVVDAKLARTAKARAVLQSAFYSKLLADLQEVEPRSMHLALGNGEVSSFRVADFAAYERRIRELLELAIAEDALDNPPLTPYPEPVEHCAVCRWSANCNARRRADDDLSLIAGMRASQRLAMKAVGVETRRAFASLEQLPKLSRGDQGSLERAQMQARLQVASEDAGEIQYEVIEPEQDDDGELIANRGLLGLPEPCAGDLFFDIEGARYYSEDGREFGLQYLFGIVDTADVGDDGAPRYTQIWAFDRGGEKGAFEELIDFITARRKQNPGLHVYHYNHYEPTSVEQLTVLHETREEAVGRLMGRFATHEDEVDDLFRLGVFVDLYRVVRQGVRAGVESYSIKALDPLMGYQRRVDLGDATTHLIAFEAALDEGQAVEATEDQGVIAGYNEDDCRSTLVLRDWLEQRRLDLQAAVGAPLPRPVVEEEPHATEDSEVVRLKEALLSGLPEESSRTEEDRARALLADLLEWHRREAKPAWWRFFHRKALSSAELVGERDAIGELQGGEIVEQVKRSVVRRFSFPPQEHGFNVGDSVCDPATGKAWSIWRLDEEHGVVDLKIGAANAEPIPCAVIECGPINTDVLAASLRDLAERVVVEGVRGADPATALLLRLRPAGDGKSAGPLRREEENTDDAAVRLILGLSESYLPIQGPPGTGKTYAAAKAILELTAAGRTVGITGPSHAVIHNLLEEICKQADEAGRSVRVGQRAEDENPFLHDRAESMPYDKIVRALEDGELDIAAGTVWMWAREDFATSVDTLVVDEAGQLSLANVLAVCGGARSVALVGDPQQLAQPSQAAHPPRSGASALEHVLGERATMPDDAGLFLDETHRMHPVLRRYSSDVFYDGRLRGIPSLDQQVVRGSNTPFTSSGLYVVEVQHEGNVNCSREEAVEVAQLVQGLLSGRWTDKKGKTQAMKAKDVLVITPYNAQIREIDRALAEAKITGVRVGTVDRFQGREAPAVVYSMATSSADDAPRGMEFLFDLHRLNVATSRPRALAIIVASPDLARVFCRTPRQMVLANAMCLAWEWEAIDRERSKDVPAV
jgi:predicted RecB family nuclease